MQMKKQYYIAYGSNLNIRQMKMRCRDARVVGTSIIEDYELLFKGSKTGSYLTIERKTGEKVPVAIWSVSKADEIALDHYEGFPHFYYKTEMVLDIKNINTGKIQKEKCFAYIMHEERDLGIPSGKYIDICIEGYASLKFNKKYLMEAKKKSEDVLKDVTRIL